MPSNSAILPLAKQSSGLALMSLRDPSRAPQVEGERLGADRARRDVPESRQLRAVYCDGALCETVEAENITTEQLLELENDKTRVRSAYVRTLNRQPTAEEIDRALTYMASFESKFAEREPLDAWESYCRILMASNEFIYVD